DQAARRLNRAGKTSRQRAEKLEEVGCPCQASRSATVHRENRRRSVRQTPRRRRGDPLAGSVDRQVCISLSRASVGIVGSKRGRNASTIGCGAGDSNGDRSCPSKAELARDSHQNI